MKVRCVRKSLEIYFMKGQATSALKNYESRKDSIKKKINVDSNRKSWRKKKNAKDANCDHEMRWPSDPESGLRWLLLMWTIHVGPQCTVWTCTGSVETHGGETWGWDGNNGSNISGEIIKWRT